MGPTTAITGMISGDTSVVSNGEDVPYRKAIARSNATTTLNVSEARKISFFFDRDKLSKDWFTPVETFAKRKDCCSALKLAALRQAG
jgi:hypothetical protein